MLKRIITALILLPVVIFAISYNSVSYRIFISLFFGFSGFEILKATKNKFSKIEILLSLITILISLNLDILKNNLYFSLIAFIILTFKILLTNEPDIFYKKVKVISFDILYIGFLGLNANILFNKYGLKIIYFILIITWLTDSFAYFCGYFFGKHKITKISPNKTLEGYLGSVILTTVVCLFLKKYFININYIKSFIFIFILTITGQLGDLLASAIKRAINIKDFGNVFPGHGGFTDRLDSILINITFGVFLLNILNL